MVALNASVLELYFSVPKNKTNYQRRQAIGVGEMGGVVEQGSARAESAPLQYSFLSGRA